MLDSGTQEAPRFRIKVQPVATEAEKPNTIAKVKVPFPFQEVTGRDYGRLNRRLLWEARSQSQNHPECTKHGGLRVYLGQLAGWP